MFKKGLAESVTVFFGLHKFVYRIFKLDYVEIRNVLGFGKDIIGIGHFIGNSII